METAIILQARLGSKRLPGKVLKKINGKTILEYTIERLKKTRLSKNIIVATTNRHEDQKILRMAKKMNCYIFAGSTNNVLNRYYKAASYYDVKNIVRVCSDSPLIDPKIINKVYFFYLRNNYDYVSNRITPKYPDGLDVEIFSFRTLQIAAQNAKWSSERELVTTYITKNPKIFKIFSYENQDDLSHYRWTVDEQKDLEFVRKIYSIMKPKTNFSMNEIIEILLKNSELLKINSGIMRNEGHLKLYDNDKLVK